MEGISHQSTILLVLYMPSLVLNFVRTAEDNDS